MASDVRLLAIDLGLRCGWAAFDGDGRLFAYGSRHFGSRAALRKAIPRILDDHPQLATLVVEGGGELFVPWQKEARRRGIAVEQVMGEEWRRRILLPRQRANGKDAKAAADGAAREVIEHSGAKRPTSLRHDAAEAILVGTWACGEPRVFRRGGGRTATSFRSPRERRSPGDTPGPR
jgi:hypothetical protein